MRGRPATDTALGLLAVVFWGSTIGVSRSLVEKVGPMTAAASLLLLSGVVGCAWLALSDRGRRSVAGLPAKYLLGCGLLLALYDVCLYLAIGLATGRAQVLVVGVINYLWPGLTLILSVPILKQRARATLLPGAAVAFGGVVLAMVGGAGLPGAAFLSAFRGSPIPYALALVAAVTWALYSNLARRWAGGAEGGAVPVFLLAAGLLMVPLRFLFREQSYWSPSAAGEVLFLAAFPSLLAYVFWDRAVRRGDHALVAAFSYVTPVLSTAISCAYLRVVPGWHLWAACALVVGGAIVCRLSIQGPEPTPG